MSSTLSTLPLLAAGGTNGALITFLIYTLAVFGLAALSNRLLKKRSFLSEYFLGSRSLGVWAFALTFAATSASGGSFTGFPSKIYSHGWILALWIGSYMVVPICTMGFLGKRINQVARISGSITVPDVIRDRFHSAVFGLVAVSLIVFFMSFNLVAQFKAGSEILNTLLQDVPQFKATVGWVSHAKSGIGFLDIDKVDPAYFLCLMTFAIAVIIYTTYGGFHAVVWTDVMQGVVMVVGVLIMLPLAIYAVGGLGNATQQMARMTPPRLGLAKFEVDTPPAENFAFVSPWFILPEETRAATEEGSAISDESAGRPRIVRVNRTLTIPAGQTVVEDIKFVEITTPEEIDRQLERLNQTPAVKLFNNRIVLLKKSQIRWLQRQLDRGAGNSQELNAQISRLEREMKQVAGNALAVLNAPELNAITPTVTFLKGYQFGDGQAGVYVTGPGPTPPRLPDKASDSLPSDRDDFRGFLPLSLAVSFFFMWSISGSGQPSNMVRLMAFNNATTLRRSIFTVAIYYTMIYLPLIVIFCCARVLLPGMDLESDRIMPQMAVTLTAGAGIAWVAGLLVAAPFAAVMSTVDSFLLMISSALVRDIYQRNVNPEVQEKTIKRLSYFFTFLVGAAAMLGAINPPQFLQDIIVYTGSGLAACFLAPMVFGLYWPRANTIGSMAGMLAGFAAHLAMYVAGIFENGSFFKPYQLFDFDPIIVGLVVSFVTVFAVTKLTPPPPEELVKKYFHKNN